MAPEYRFLNVGELILPTDEHVVETWEPCGAEGYSVQPGEVFRRRVAGGFPPQSRDLDDLETSFRNLVAETIAACAEFGVTIVPTRTYRPPDAQARLWRSSRTADEVSAAVAALQAHGRPVTAQILEGVGPQPGKLGRHVTNALPGESWHNIRPAMAADVAWMVDGVVVWDTERSAGAYNRNGYRLFRDEATKRGLYRGPAWDWAHIQAAPGAADADAAETYFASVIGA